MTDSMHVVSMYVRLRELRYAAHACGHILLWQLVYFLQHEDICPHCTPLTFSLECRLVGVITVQVVFNLLSHHLLSRLTAGSGVSCKVVDLHTPPYGNCSRTGANKSPLPVENQGTGFC